MKIIKSTRFKDKYTIDGLKPMDISDLIRLRQLLESFLEIKSQELMVESIVPFDL